MAEHQLAPIHPGEILKEEFALPLCISAGELAAALHVPGHQVADVMAEHAAITADLALRLARYFGTSADFWLGLQTEFDLRMASRVAGAAIERDVRPRAA